MRTMDTSVEVALRWERIDGFCRGGFDMRNEHTPAAQVWITSEKIVTLQTPGPIQVYTERSFKDGSVKTQYFIKTGKP
jgi:hypothetical protein